MIVPAQRRDIGALACFKDKARRGFYLTRYNYCIFVLNLVVVSISNCSCTNGLYSDLYIFGEYYSWVKISDEPAAEGFNINFL